MEQQLDEPLTGDARPPRGGARPASGDSIQMLEDREPVAGRERAAHDRPGDPGPRSSARSPRRASSTAPAARRHRHGPAQRGGAGDGDRARASTPTSARQINPELERNRPVTDTFEPGLDLQGRDDGGGARGPEGRCPAPPSPARPTITRYDRTLRDAHERPAVTLTASEILAQSSNIGTVLIAERVGADAAAGLDRAVRVRQPHRHRLPGRGGGPRPAARALVGHLDHQHPDRPGHRRHAGPAHARLRRRRQRRPAGGAAPGGPRRRRRPSSTRRGARS